jgi:hypothetical protein
MVLIVSLDNLPDWLPAWCLDQLGDEPADVLFQRRQVSMVIGLRLAGGTDVVVKARADDGRAASCVAAQARLAEHGFPCARPLTPAVNLGSLAVHAEEFRPGGEVLTGDSPAVARRYAEVFARLMAELADVTVPPPLPNPPWVRWDHADSGLWPAIEVLDNQDQSVVPAYIADTAERTRHRMLAARASAIAGPLCSAKARASSLDRQTSIILAPASSIPEMRLSRPSGPGPASPAAPIMFSNCLSSSGLDHSNSTTVQYGMENLRGRTGSAAPAY